MSIIGLKKTYAKKKTSIFKNRDAGYNLDDMNQEDISIQNQYSI